LGFYRDGIDVIFVTYFAFCLLWRRMRLRAAFVPVRTGFEASSSRS